MSLSTASATRAVRAGIESDTQHGAVVPPLHLSTNYSFAGFGEKRAYDYSRSGNPTRDLLGEALAELEQGAGAVVTASGMAAVAAALELVPAGGRVLAAHDCYGGTWRLLDAWAKKGRFTVEFADLTDPAALAAGLAGKPDLVWVETPSNPLLRITDIRHVAQAAHAADALCVVDNTFLSPALQQPLALGADVVVHSTTKYINGHSDVVGGAVVARTPELAEQLKWWANCLGLTGAPFDSFLTLRGLRTLGARLRVHQENATAYRRAARRSPGGANRCITRAWPRIRNTRWRRASSTASAPWSASSWRAARMRSALSSTAWRSSRWPNRWAAWRAWSRTRPA